MDLNEIKRKSKERLNESSNDAARNSENSGIVDRPLPSKMASERGLILEAQQQNVKLRRQNYDAVSGVS